MGGCQCFGTNSGKSSGQGDGSTRRAPIRFSYSELETATHNFREVIGEGTFGAVYRGTLRRSGQNIAVKRLNNAQGESKFRMEVMMLSLLRHPNLVDLIGYCSVGDHRLLVYEFMPLGSLQSKLHTSSFGGTRNLDWYTRMRIAAGAAKGLSYLHNEIDPPVMMRDLTSSSILLDQGFRPKLSGLGHAKFDTNNSSHSQPPSRKGYCAPEYAAHGTLSLKSDVYSFGIILLEMISGTIPAHMMIGNGKHMLTDWVPPMLRNRGDIWNIADHQMQRNFTYGSLYRALEVAMMCLGNDPDSRPNINFVVQTLDRLASRNDVAAASTSGADALVEHPRRPRAEGPVENEIEEEERLVRRPRRRRRNPPPVENEIEEEVQT
ncbi:hypothetical protein ACS0TY_020919 [Phlomoides rotata]